MFRGTRLRLVNKTTAFGAGTVSARTEVCHESREKSAMSCDVTVCYYTIRIGFEDPHVVLSLSLLIVHVLICLRVPADLYLPGEAPTGGAMAHQALRGVLCL